MWQGMLKCSFWQYLELHIPPRVSMLWVDHCWELKPLSALHRLFSWKCSQNSLICLKLSFSCLLHFPVKASEGQGGILKGVSSTVWAPCAKATGAKSIKCFKAVGDRYRAGISFRYQIVWNADSPVTSCSQPACERAAVSFSLPPPPTFLLLCPLKGELSSSNSVWNTEDWLSCHSA